MSDSVGHVIDTTRIPQGTEFLGEFGKGRRRGFTKDRIGESPTHIEHRIAASFGPVVKTVLTIWGPRAPHCLVLVSRLLNTWPGANVEATVA